MKTESGIELSEEMRLAWEFVEHTDTSVFLTGKAGTGKTTFLRYVTTHTSKTYVVTAPTGVAAINAGGVTLHSFFQLPIAPYVPGSTVKTNYRISKQKLRIIRALDLLIIDEISMVRSDLLDSVDAMLRRLRQSNLPFGGVQLLMVGDLQQLSPVVTARDAAVLDGHYSTPYFFGSKALMNTSYLTVGLRRVFRQQDMEFVRLLNHVRANRLTYSDIQRLDALWRPDSESMSEMGYIRLTTHNSQADSYNTGRLNALPGRSYMFRAKVEGDFPASSYPTDSDLSLKVGAQVMFIKNDSAGRFYNGKIARVISISENGVEVSCLDDGEEVTVEPMVWENMRYEVDDEQNVVKSCVEGIFSQLPLRLAWAITIHKSQGLTFDKAVIDAGRAFAPGQVYVALSRCRSLEGIVLATRLRDGSMMSDATVLNYISGQVEAAEQSKLRLDDIRCRYHRSLMQDMFTFADIGKSLNRLCRFAGEHLGKGGAALVSLMSEAEETMQANITEVATKWRASLERYHFDQLDSPLVRSRMENSISYFLKHLEEDISIPLDILSQVKPGNKLNATRWKELYDEFMTACTRKRLLLEKMAGMSFTVPFYLKSRRDATLESEKSKNKKNTKKVKVTVRKRAKTGKKD